MYEKTGLAMWHYHHRNVIENVCFFADCGFRLLSLNSLITSIFPLFMREKVNSGLIVIIFKRCLMRGVKF